ncbi:MAG: cadherin repeat domain-containing protein [Fuerstiella sp.]|nr:cadherin repeat domain-containing protein [Fuerstiella sp.]
MQSNNRTILLAGILAAVLAFGMGRPIFMEPILNARQDLADARRDLEDAEGNDWELQLARGRLKDIKAASLPPSLNDAQRLYLEWITDLTQECRFARCTVVPGGRQPRAGKYLLVSVVVNAEASLENFCRFLFNFRQAELMHRITKMDVSSSGTTGKPTMEFSFTAEGMGIIGSEHKTELSASAPLADSADSKTTQIRVDSTESFPSKTPFMTKVGFETVRVTEIHGDVWTVERGVDGSNAQKHGKSTVIQHFPVAWDQRHRQFRDYSSFLDESPFSKPPVPRHYNPELAGLNDVTIAPGQTLTMLARIDKYDMDIGALEFSLKEAPAGASIDAVTGQIHWELSDEQEPRDYLVTVLATQRNNPGLSLQQTLTITVKLSNNRPEIEVAAYAVVLLGQKFTLRATATDDGDPAKLVYSLDADSLPEGLTIGKTTGIIVWTPEQTLTPGSHTVQIKVTDQGDPPKSDSASVTLEVKDDDARFTQLTAIVRKDGRPEAWFENTRTNTQTILQEGDQLEVADIAAKIVEIQGRMVELQDDEGVWQIALGNDARNRILKAAAQNQAGHKGVNPDESPRVNKTARP